MSKILYVIVGGGLGAGMRYIIASSDWMRMENGFPLGTLAVNLIGCLLIGLIWGLVLDSPLVKPLIIAGFLGGFTTFSSFGLDAFQLYNHGKVNMMLLYVLLSNIVGLLLVFIGFKLGTIFD